MAAPIAVLVACNALTGASDLEVGGVPVALPDAAPRDSGGDAASAPPPPPPPAADGGSDACTLQIPGAPDASGAITASRATIAIDGDLSDWACIPFVHVSPTSGDLVKPDAATATLPNTFDFAVSWDDAAIRVAIHVVDATAEGNADPQHDFENDSVEIYIDADGVLTGVYGANDHQWIVDHLNQVEVYRWVPGSSLSSPSASFASAVRVGNGTIDYEIAIPASDLGMKALKAGAHVGFDVAANDGDGTAQIEQLLWYEATGCTCVNGCCCNGMGGKTDQPFCDTQRFGAVILAP
ncbi:MAG TPA: sugar-binding protein [Labilithrix sp.]